MNSASQTRCEIVAEIGINHQGSLDIARSLVRMAAECGVDSIKLQRRVPELAVARTKWNVERDTPWGRMRTIDYRRRMELSASDFEAIAELCRSLGIRWFASAWDVPSLLFLCERGCERIKIPSARNTDVPLLEAARDSGLPVILSTGMAGVAEIDQAVKILGKQHLTLLHTVSGYPIANEDANLRCMQTLRERYGVPTGYSGHEIGIQISSAAVALGACMVERHVTLDHDLPGSDHRAALEPKGLALLVRDIRAVEAALGDGVKRIAECERGQMERLRA